MGAKRDRESIDNNFLPLSIECFNMHAIEDDFGAGFAPEGKT